jgi:hypothetical protein
MTAMQSRYLFAFHPGSFEVVHDVVDTRRRPATRAEKKIKKKYIREAVESSNTKGHGLARVAKSQSTEPTPYQFPLLKAFGVESMKPVHLVLRRPKSATPEKAFSSVKQIMRRILGRTIDTLVGCDTEVSHSIMLTLSRPARPGDGRSQTAGDSRSDTEMPSWENAERPAPHSLVS